MGSHCSCFWSGNPISTLMKSTYYITSVARQGPLYPDRIWWSTIFSWITKGPPSWFLCDKFTTFHHSGDSLVSFWKGNSGPFSQKKILHFSNPDLNLLIRFMFTVTVIINFGTWERFLSQQKKRKKTGENCGDLTPRPPVGEGNHLPIFWGFEVGWLILKHYKGNSLVGGSVWR